MNKLKENKQQIEMCINLLYQIWSGKLIPLQAMFYEILITEKLKDLTGRNIINIDELEAELEEL